MKNKSTQEVFSEQGQWLRFGWLPFHIRPLTLNQIWEIGEEVNRCDKLDIEGTFNSIEKMLSAHRDLRALQRVVIKALFRSWWMRLLFGRYIRRHTTMGHYRRVIEFCAKSFDAPFFFQSMTFLNGAKRTAMSTRAAQALGASSAQ